MPGLTHICSGVCHTCSEHEFGPDYEERGNHALRIFHLVRAYYPGTRKTSTEIMDCWECQTCKTLVPFDTFKYYQDTGEVLIKPKKNRR